MEKIRNAALKLFSIHGAEATSLRMGANSAGVSIGLVQHHFGTKAGLIKAANDYMMSVLGQQLAGPLTAPPADPVAEVGHRINTLVAEHTYVVDYLARVLVDANGIGSVVFDQLATIATALWEQLISEQRTPPDLDPTWAALNPMMLMLGAIILRSHIDRHLPEPLTSPRQLQRWDKAVSVLISQGQLRTDGE